jgi:hypothetical protein
MLDLWLINVNLVDLLLPRILMKLYLDFLLLPGVLLDVNLVSLLTLLNLGLLGLHLYMNMLIA